MYGQTNSGKTYTMKGSSSSENENAEPNPGLIQMTLREIFAKGELLKNSQIKVQISYYEIYQEKIYDLLSKNSNSLEIREIANNKTKIVDLLVKGA